MEINANTSFGLPGEMVIRWASSTVWIYTWSLSDKYTAYYMLDVILPRGRYSTSIGIVRNNHNPCLDVLCSRTIARVRLNTQIETPIEMVAIAEELARNPDKYQDGL